jgi:hypothetical protein
MSECPNRAAGIVLGDGFACVHIQVRAETAEFTHVVTAIKAMKDRLQRHGADTPFPEAFEQRLRSIRGVRSVVVEGPFSSILIPLHLARRFTDRPVHFHGALGQGPAAQHVRKLLATAGIDGHFALRDGDSPLEIEVSDDRGRRRITRLYLPRKLKHRFKLSAESLKEVRGFLLSQYNAGRAAVAEQVRAAGGFTSLRVGEINRHVSATDYLGVLRHFHHVIVPQRDNVLRQVARAAGLKPPRGWPKGFDGLAAQLAEDLGRREGGPRLVVLVFHARREAVFCLPGEPPVCLRAPERFDTASRISRLQGACASLALGAGGPFEWNGYLPSPKSLNDFAEWATQAAYFGTDRRPWTCPSPAFRPAESWRV